MCGITGFWSFSGLNNDIDAPTTIKKMTNSLTHRGPDQAGIWLDREAGIALGHRRLSILDLSLHGKQPMCSHDGRWVVVYNGEIYNYKTLRTELEALGEQFKSSSDTEVLVAAIAQWGMLATLKKLVGMFAIAAWDKQQRQLHLSRDHIGIKPLYWSKNRNGIAFGSEIKAISPHPAFERTINHTAVTAYMRLGYIPAPMSIWEGTFKCAPGTLLTFSGSHQPRTTAFWSLQETYRHGLTNPLDVSDEEATNQLHTLLKEAVHSQMAADVPLGAFLSGGIDSSTVAALMQASESNQVKTFSIGFHQQGFNEAHHAAEVAKHLGTEHTELYIEPAHAQAIIPSLSTIYDEPFADSSQIPTYLLSQMTRKHVTVALSGDGGDESFAGYPRFSYARQLAKGIYRAPKFLRHSTAALLERLPPHLGNALGRNLPSNLKRHNLGDQLNRLAGVLRRGEKEIYLGMLSHWQQPEHIVIGGHEPYHLMNDEQLAKHIPDFLSRMQYMDSMVYLPDDILVKVDRASMAHSLEIRVPLLDHRVVEFAWRLPTHLKEREDGGKWLLRQVLYRHVPRELVDRPKMGFGVPIGDWLRGPLKEWAWERLCPASLHKHGLLQPTLMQEAWEQHQKGERNWQYPLWTALMLQDWLETNET